MYDYALTNPITMGLASVPRSSPDSPWAPHQGLTYELQGAPSASRERRRQRVAPLSKPDTRPSDEDKRSMKDKSRVGSREEKDHMATWTDIALKEAPFVLQEKGSVERDSSGPIAST